MIRGDDARSSFEHLLMVPVLFSPIIDPRDDASICAGDHYPPLLSSIRHRQAFPWSDHSSMQRKVCPGETKNGSDLPLPVAVPAVFLEGSSPDPVNGRFGH